jgi:membrane fusion protein, multidrug efflux system
MERLGLSNTYLFCDKLNAEYQLLNLGKNKTVSSNQQKYKPVEDVMKIRIIIGAIVCVLILIVVSFAQRNTEKQKDKIEALPLSVKVQTLQQEKFKKNLDVSGTIEGENEAVIISETNGKVTGLKANIGDWVTKGQVVVQVENELQKAAFLQAKAQVLAAQTNFEKAQADLKRVENLLEQKIATQSDFENARLGAQAAEAQLKGAEAGLMQVKKQYDDTSIKTPLSGKLADRYVEEAALITPGAMVAVVVNNKNMKLKSSVAENEVTLLTKNAATMLVVDAVPNKKFIGKVTSIAQKANNEHNYPIEIVVANDKEESLKSGMFGRATIEVASLDNAIVIPANAISTDAQKNHYVFVDKNGIAIRQNIELGLDNDGFVQVIKGLTIGDRLIIMGQQNLTNGTKIAVD